MWKKIQTKLKPTPAGDRDWLEWMDIKKLDRVELIEKAIRLKVPVFKGDTDRLIYERVTTAETLKLNKRTVNINFFLAFVAFVSALVSMLGLFRQ